MKRLVEVAVVLLSVNAAATTAEWADDIPRLGVNALLESVNRKGFNPDEVIPVDVAHWRRLGLKLMRIHFSDVGASQPDGTLIDNALMAGLDRLVYECGRNGIGVMLTPIAWWHGKKNHGGFSSYYTMPEMTSDPKARAAQVKFLSQFAAHRNRLNGLRYADDPAIVGFECINEPIYPRDWPDERVTEYVDALAAAIRSTGTKKPVFFNCWQGGAKGTYGSSIDGVSGNFYPNGGHGAGRTMVGPFMRIVAHTTIPDAMAGCAPRPKLVYEFDSADIRSAYMFPTMAKAMRAEGVVYAAHFNYDSLPFADENFTTLSHYLNLVYTPEVALSMAIAQEVFTRVPAGTPYCTPTNGRLDFAPFKIDEKRNTSEMVTETDMLYANDALSSAPAPEKLRRVWGRGKSSVVASCGNGAYFFDRAAPGAWRVQLYPSVRNLADPHQWKRGEKKVAVLGDAIELTLALPDLGADFEVWPALLSKKSPVRARNGRVTLAPGDYVFVRTGEGRAKAVDAGRAKAVDAGRGLDVPKYFAPPSVANPGPEWQATLKPAYTKVEAGTFEGLRNVLGDILLDGQVATALEGKTIDDLTTARLVLKVRSLKPVTTVAELSLAPGNLNRWTTNIPVSPELREVSVPLSQFTYRGDNPAPTKVPNLLAVRKMTLMIGKWLYPKTWNQPHGMEVTDVRLEF